MHFKAFLFLMILTYFECLISWSFYQICTNEVWKYRRKSCRQKYVCVLTNLFSKICLFFSALELKCQSKNEKKLKISIFRKSKTKWKKTKVYFYFYFIRNVFRKKWPRYFWDETFQKCALNPRFVNVTSKILKILTKLRKKNSLKMCFCIYMWSYRSIGHQIKNFIRELHGPFKVHTLSFALSNLN